MRTPARNSRIRRLIQPKLKVANERYSEYKIALRLLSEQPEDKIPSKFFNKVEECYERWQRSTNKLNTFIADLRAKKEEKCAEHSGSSPRLKRSRTK